MKILYSIQATGNGHISRAMELLPYLKQYGHIDIFLSGANSSLELDAPIKYRSKGLSLYYTCKGSLDYWKLAKSISPLGIIKEAKDLPVEKYDLIINDFECITSIACARKKVPSVNFGHQASFQSLKTPRPEKKNKVGEWILRNYAKANQYIGLHFDCYDDFIITPVIKKEIREAEPVNKGHITVYLPSYCDNQLKAFLSPYKDFQFEIFSHHAKTAYREGNIYLRPVSKTEFNNSFVNCYGIITGAGFETPAEALYMKKKMIAIPIKGQYEQECNAAALRKLGIKTLTKLDDDFDDTFKSWVNDPTTVSAPYKYSTEEAVKFLMYNATNLKYSNEELYPEIAFN
jgi:uncharacterized protein (TIGR00661 family)